MRHQRIVLPITGTIIILLNVFHAEFLNFFFQKKLLSLESVAEILSEIVCQFFKQTSPRHT